VRLSQDQLTRASYVLNIHAALRTVFENPENLYGFMAMPNNNPTSTAQGRWRSLERAISGLCMKRRNGWMPCEVAFGRPTNADGDPH